MELKSKKKFGDSFKYAWYGISYTFKTEFNFRLEIIAAILVIIASVFFKISIFEWIIALLLIAFVLITELINTAFENFVDLLTEKFHPLAKNVKDVMAGCVLVVNVFAAIIGFTIYLPKIIDLIKGLGL